MDSKWIVLTVTLEKKKESEKISYQDKLSKDARARYLEKLASVNDVDPYNLATRSWKADLALLPPTLYLDIISYLVYGISVYTSQQFKNYKSLEADGYFTNGWVQLE